MTELERCIAFLREIDRRAAGRQVPFRFGTAYLRDELPSVWSRNYLSLERDLDEATAEQVARRGGARARRGGRRPPQARGLRRGGRRAARSGARRARLAGRVRRGHGRGERAGREASTSPSAEEVSHEELEPVWAESNRSRGPHRRRGVSSASSLRASACSRPRSTSASSAPAPTARSAPTASCTRSEGIGADRERPHARAVPQPRARASARPAGSGHLPGRRQRPHVPAREPGRLAQGALPQARASTRSASSTTS